MTIETSRYALTYEIIVDMLNFKVYIENAIWNIINQKPSTHMLNCGCGCANMQTYGSNLFKEWQIIPKCIGIQHFCDFLYNGWTFISFLNNNQIISKLCRIYLLSCIQVRSIYITHKSIRHKSTAICAGSVSQNKSKPSLIWNHGPHSPWSIINWCSVWLNKVLKCLDFAPKKEGRLGLDIIYLCTCTCWFLHYLSILKFVL